MDHVFLPNVQVGLNIERSLTTWDDDAHEHASRGVLFERYVMLPGSSFYLPPFEYVEAFEALQSNPLPEPSAPSPGAMAFHQQTLTGLHYHVNLETPYWNPEGGFAARHDVCGGFARVGRAPVLSGVLFPVIVCQDFPRLVRTQRGFPLPPLAGRFAIGRRGRTAPTRSRMTHRSSRWAAATCSAVTA